MSGHSKWHSIKHKKGAADKARGKLFAVLIRQIGCTALFVTHDQVEALSLADRVAVMSQGRILQEGTPLQLYGRPTRPAVVGGYGSRGRTATEPPPRPAPEPDDRFHRIAS